MMISDEQARLARNARSGETSLAEGPTPVPIEFVDRVRDAVMRCPDTRAERVAEARVHLARGIDARAVADRMITRIVCDRLR